MNKIVKINIIFGIFLLIKNFNFNSFSKINLINFRKNLLYEDEFIEIKKLENNYIISFIHSYEKEKEINLYNINNYKKTIINNLSKNTEFKNIIKKIHSYNTNISNIFKSYQINQILSGGIFLSLISISTSGILVHFFKKATQKSNLKINIPPIEEIDFFKENKIQEIINNLIQETSFSNLPKLNTYIKNYINNSRFSEKLDSSIKSNSPFVLNHLEFFINSRLNNFKVELKNEFKSILQIIKKGTFLVGILATGSIFSLIYFKKKLKNFENKKIELENEIKKIIYKKIEEIINN